MKDDSMWDRFSSHDWREDLPENSLCLDCLQPMEDETDIQLCQKCMKNYDVEKLWQDHDNNLIDALDFNESQSIRDKYRKD
jgi:hypothetical protein